MNEIEIRLFGSFRKFISSGSIKVRIPSQITVAQLKEIVNCELQRQSSEFTDSNLVYESAVATESEVLAEDDMVKDLHRLALLPPVCGG
jgi:molybdopterin converting factor small subunit